MSLTTPATRPRLYLKSESPQYKDIQYSPLKEKGAHQDLEKRDASLHMTDTILYGATYIHLKKCSAPGKRDVSTME